MHFITEPVSRLATSDALMTTVYNLGHTDDVVTIFDADTRRWLKTTCRGAHEFLEDHGMLHLDDEDHPDQGASMRAAIRSELDTGSPNLTALVVTLDGEVLSRSTDPYDDVTPGTHYASLGEYQIPADVKTLARDELVEVSRLVAFTDIVIPASSPSLDSERLVFKYYQHVIGIQENWNAIHIGAKLAAHPHIVPVRHVIVDETDRSRVVGFTMPFIPGGDLGQTIQSRPFKLKWAKQLCQTVDDLHLKYGVFHGDIREGNLVVDPVTDNLILIDFGCAAKIGTPKPERHTQAALSPEAPDIPRLSVARDVQMAFVAVWHLVAGASNRLLIDSRGGLRVANAEYLKKGGWVKGRDITLDSPVEAYYRVMVDWLRRRNNGPQITQHDQASEPLNYPDYMPPPQVDIDRHQRIQAAEKKSAMNTGHSGPCCPCRPQYQPPGPPQPLQSTAGPDTRLLEEVYAPGCVFWKLWQYETGITVPMQTSGRHFLRFMAIEDGRQVLNWERPSTAHLDRGRRLLANGKYEDEHVAVAGAGTKSNKRKRVNNEEEEEEEEATEEDSCREGGEPDGCHVDGDEGASGGETGKASTTDKATRRVTRSTTKRVAAAAAAAAAADATPAPRPKPTAGKTRAPKDGKAAGSAKKTRNRGVPNGK
ncbi:hypothetical protein BR93DRAFT_958599 [Coniochaeta sp. PMI_546]|nr:hypothetical protein BR93DRAFT_958599 [Coniochaeta sp. PMI_546]